MLCEVGASDHQDAHNGRGGDHGEGHGRTTNKESIYTYTFFLFITFFLNINNRTRDFDNF